MRLKAVTVQRVELQLRDRKRAATRLALEKAALELFVAQGFSRTSIDEIAARADVSRSTFFRYFGSKDAVLFAREEEAGDRFAELIRSRPSSDGPLHAFEHAMVSLVEETSFDLPLDLMAARQRLLSTDPVLKVRRAENLTRWADRIARVLAEREGHDVPRTSHRLAAGVGIAVLQEMGEQWEPRDESDFVPLIKGRFDLLRKLIVRDSEAQTADTATAT